MKINKTNNHQKDEDIDFNVEKAPKRNSYRRISDKVCFPSLRPRTKSILFTVRRESKYLTSARDFTFHTPQLPI